jgi:hypothetical protein
MIFLLVFAVHALAASPARAEALREAEVAALLGRIDRAFAARDLDAVARELDEGIGIRGTLRHGDKTTTHAYDKSAYLAAVRDSWAQASDYRYERTEPALVLSGDTATATALVVESSVFGSDRVRTRSRETVTLRRVEGGVRITEVAFEGELSIERGAAAVQSHPQR